MYVAVKGGEKAIAAAHQLLAHERRGDTRVDELECAQIEQQLGLAVDRVMSEGGIYDRQLAALAIKQSSGDLVEAIFLLRAYRTTLPRLATSQPLDTSDMRLERRKALAFRDRQTALDNRGSPRLSEWRDGSCVWSVRRDSRGYSPR